MSKTLEAAMHTVRGLAAPRSQAEWRKVSTVLRLARREALRLNRMCEGHVECGGWYRRIRAGTWELVTVYNGPSPISDLLMIAFHRRQHIAGIGHGRLEDARIFARRSRESGPIRIP